MKDISQLLLYRNFDNGDILYDMMWIYKEVEASFTDAEGMRDSLYTTINKLIELSVSHGFEGNLWHTYLAYLLANNENSYSTACEIKGEIEGSINDIALNDFAIFRSLYNMDFSQVEEELGVNCISMIQSFKGNNNGPKLFNSRIRDRIVELSKALGESKDVNEFKMIVTQFYKEFGVGKFGLHKAFRLNDNGDIVPINNTAHVSLDDLVGYEIPKQKLIDNTESFVKGKKANNCLLFGDAGTGKSSSIKAILNQYYPDGLRMIEVYKHQFKYLTNVLSQVKNRNYKFIIYMDDLSFEEFEIEYKYLKAIIEGGLEKKPDNVLIYATSNRRHLVREKFSDKHENEDDLHKSDTVQEKLSLVARFGVTIYLGSPDKKEFQAIVKALAAREDINISEEELLLEANKWEVSHGGLSGRTARQFIDYLAAKE